jgi:hypothetical protein
MSPQRRVLLLRFISKALLSPYFRTEWVEAPLPREWEAVGGWLEGGWRVVRRWLGRGQWLRWDVRGCLAFLYAPPVRSAPAGGAARHAHRRARARRHGARGAGGAAVGPPLRAGALPVRRLPCISLVLPPHHPLLPRLCDAHSPSLALSYASLSLPVEAPHILCPSSPPFSPS